MAPNTPRRRKPLVHRGEELRCTWRFEEEARAEGRLAVAGLDEVGRGALCGPVVAGVVVLGEGFPAEGLDDSKRLTVNQREAHGRAHPGEGARVGARGGRSRGDRPPQHPARHLPGHAAGPRRARPSAPDLVLVDGDFDVPGIPVPQRSIVKGDALSVSIAAASVVAKVARDAMMREYDRRYPGYGLARNMGYAADDHREALRRMGPSEIHRRSFHGTERWLF